MNKILYFKSKQGDRHYVVRENTYITISDNSVSISSDGAEVVKQLGHKMIEIEETEYLDLLNLAFDRLNISRINGCVVCGKELDLVCSLGCSLRLEEEMEDEDNGGGVEGTATEEPTTESAGRNADETELASAAAGDESESVSEGS